MHSKTGLIVHLYGSPVGKMFEGLGKSCLGLVRVSSKTSSLTMSVTIPVYCILSSYMKGHDGQLLRHYLLNCHTSNTINNHISNTGLKLAQTLELRHKTTEFSSIRN